MYRSVKFDGCGRKCSTGCFVRASLSRFTWKTCCISNWAPSIVSIDELADRCNPTMTIEMPVCIFINPPAPRKILSNGDVHQTPISWNFVVVSFKSFSTLQVYSKHLYIQKPALFPTTLLTIVESVPTKRTRTSIASLEPLEQTRTVEQILASAAALTRQLPIP